jgi:hypothetical protein
MHSAIIHPKLTTEMVDAANRHSSVMTGLTWRALSQI